MIPIRGNLHLNTLVLFLISIISLQFFLTVSYLCEITYLIVYISYLFH